MKTIHNEAFDVTGLSTRTNNADEMNPDSAKIGALHQRFDENVQVNYQAGARVYGVYYDYESDASGEFSVLAGADRVEFASVELETVKIPAGDYLVFEGKGEMPNAVIDAWGKVWAYFSAENCQHERSYTVDYEYHKEPNAVEIHIAVN